MIFSDTDIATLTFIKLVPFRVKILYFLWIYLGRQIKGQGVSYYQWVPPAQLPLSLVLASSLPTSDTPPPRPLLQTLSLRPGSYSVTAVVCGGSLQLSSGSPTYIVSPRYPEAYPPNVECQWKITAPFGNRILLYFEHLMLPPNDHPACTKDHIEITDIHFTHRYCNYQYGVNYLSVAPTISVQFTSDRIREDFPARFRIRLEVKSNYCGGELTGPTGEINSPNFPHVYTSNIVCGWKITAPIRSRIRLQCPSTFWLEPNSDCSNDFLSISTSGDDSMKASKRFCGFHGPGTMISDSNVMSILFYSNAQYGFNGFRCYYNIIDSAGGFSYPSVASLSSPNTIAMTTDYPSHYGMTIAQPLQATPTIYSQPCDCGRANKKSVREARIVGGTQTEINAYPWVVAVFKKDGRQYCAGSLINEQYILTASHCVARLNPSEIYVSLGDHDLDIMEEARSLMVKIRRIIVHPGYRSTPVETDDIALLELNQPIILSSTVQPICLPPPELDIRGQIPTVVGWGKLSEAGLSTSVLRETALPIQSNIECQKAYGFSAVTEKMICAGQLDGRRDACQGDSGGPMMVIRQQRWYMIGLVSYGFGCARPEFPGVYTRIDRYLDWIRTHAENTNVCTSVPRPDKSVYSSPTKAERSQHQLQNRLLNSFGFKWNFPQMTHYRLTSETTRSGLVNVGQNNSRNHSSSQWFIQLPIN